MASHTVTHSHGSNFNEEKWANEVIGMAEMLVRYAGVNPKDIKGMRAPFLAVGGDTMFRMLNRYGLIYDSSMSVPTPSWPYTLDYKLPHTCAVKPCPTESHPGNQALPATIMACVQALKYTLPSAAAAPVITFLQLLAAAAAMRFTQL